MNIKDKIVPGTVPVRSYVTRAQIGSVIASIGIAVALTLLYSGRIGYGFLAGAAVSIVNFQLMAVDAFELVEKSPKKAQMFILGRYVIRYAIMFGVIAIIVTRTDLNIFATFAGLFFVQLRLFASHIYHSVKNGGGLFRSLK